MSEVQKTFIVMHDKGENVNGVNIRPYEKFKSISTPELELKVKKGFLEVEEKKKSAPRSKKNK
jgi:hypothetical protein